MRAEIIAIGDELTSGQRLDTNSQWLSRELADLGVRVVAHTTVADDLPTKVDAIRHAISRAEIVICSGGLGPTADDLTRVAFAQAAGVELTIDEDVLAHIRGLFETMGREMPERNIVQAQFPVGATVIPNPHGSAPGFELEIANDGGTARFFTLPGVPAELTEMYQETVRGRIEAILGNERKFIRHRALKCFGIGESDMESRLPGLIERGQSPTVGITVSRATITLRISTECGSLEECQKQIAETEKVIRDCVGEFVFGEEFDELQDVVVRMLAESGRTLSVAEIGSGGLVSDWLSTADASQTSFRGGMIASNNRSVGQMLNEHELDELLDEESHAAAFGVITRESFATDYCLAIGEFPTAESASHDKATVEVVLVSKDRKHTRVEVPFSGHPDIVRHRAAKQALDLVRRVLTKREQFANSASITQPET